MQIRVYTSEHFFLTLPIVNGSTELRRVEVATVLREEEDHAFQYLPGENNSTVWPGMKLRITGISACLSARYISADVCVPLLTAMK